MAKRGYLPKDNPAVRVRVQGLINQGQFGMIRPSVLGQQVYDELRAALPEGMTKLMDGLCPDVGTTSLKGCVTIAEEEVARCILKVGADRRMAGFRGLRVQDGARTLYVQMPLLAMSLDAERAVLARYDRQIKTLEVNRATVEFCHRIHEKYPHLQTCGEALQAEGVQYEMVFDDAI